MFAQDPPLPTKDIPIVPLVIPVVDLEEDRVVPVLVERVGVADKLVEVVEIEEDDVDDDEEDRLELHDLAGPKVFLAALPVVPQEPIIEIADLEDAPSPVFNDDGSYDTEP